MVHFRFSLLLMMFIYWLQCTYCKEKRDALAVVSKEAGLEVNSDETNYMVMSRDKNAGRSHNIKADNNSFERMEQFRYLGTTIKNENSIQEEIKGRLKSGNAPLSFGAESFVFQFTIQKILD